MSAPTLSLAGRRALVTGAATGIGRATARLFAQAGASVVVNHWRQPAEAAALVQELQALGAQAVAIEADVSDTASVQALVAQFDDSLGLLREGDSTRPLFVPWDDDVRREFSAVERLWQSQRALWTAPLMPARVREALGVGGGSVPSTDGSEQIPS